MAKKVYRSKTDKILGGVCGGLSDYFSVDVVLIRLLWVFSFLAGGIGFIAYMAAWIIIPEERRIGVNQDEFEEEENIFEKKGMSDRQSQIIMGSVVIVIGVFLLVRQYLPFIPWHNIWPIGIILIGIGVLLGVFSGKSS